MQDFIQEALGVVDSLFEQHNHDPDKTVEATLEYFRKRLDSSSNDLFKVGRKISFPLWNIDRFRQFKRNLFRMEIAIMMMNNSGASLSTLIPILTPV